MNIENEQCSFKAQTKEHLLRIKKFLRNNGIVLYSIYMEYLLKVNLILSLLFLRCVDHKIIIMPLLPTVILFIDTDITARNNVDKYCNTEIIFSLEDLLFFILHCSLFTLHNSCIQIEIPSKKKFFSEHHKEPTILLQFLKMI